MTFALVTSSKPPTSNKLSVRKFVIGSSGFTLSLKQSFVCDAVSSHLVFNQDFFCKSNRRWLVGCWVTLSWSIKPEQTNVLQTQKKKLEEYLISETHFFFFLEKSIAAEILSPRATAAAATPRWKILRKWTFFFPGIFFVTHGFALRSVQMMTFWRHFNCHKTSAFQGK